MWAAIKEGHIVLLHECQHRCGERCCFSYRQPEVQRQLCQLTGLHVGIKLSTVSRDARQFRALPEVRQVWLLARHLLGISYEDRGSNAPHVEEVVKGLQLRGFDTCSLLKRET